ncbi:MAG TPA: HSP90 family protein [Microscillaceae bacterium]|nr:HSP90 family protein [Microscillaceae bacterium]
MGNKTFKVNLGGIIDLLSDHIYTTPKIFIRELLQNAVDAIQAKRLYDEHFEGRIEVQLLNEATSQIVVTDNGIGLTKEEIHRFLAVIGQSSKRDHHFENDFIGRFGIGLLSGFVVSEQITVKTKSQADDKGYLWIAQSDGTYSLEEATENLPLGTSVMLTAKSGMGYYFQEETIQELLSYYGEALPYPIRFQTASQQYHINPETPVWLRDNAARQALLAYGKEHFKQDFLDAFPIDIEALGVKGTGFISSQKLHLNSSNESKVFVKKMLLSDKVENLLPKWGFFIYTILNIDQLTPTASRESLVQDASYKICKELLAEAFKDYLKTTSEENASLFGKILNAHYQSIKMLANEDDTLLELFLDYLVFETNKGRKDVRWIKQNIDQIYFTSSLEDFKQIRRIANSKDIFIINAAYSFEEALIQSIIKKYPKLNIQPISPFDVLKEFESASPEEMVGYQEFIDKANLVMKDYFCDISLKKFLPADTPVLLVCDEQSIKNHQTHKLSGDQNNPFASFMKTAEDASKPSLCFNLNNPMVHQLLESHEKDSFPALIKLLYVQSLFLGQFPVGKGDIEILNLSLIDITNHTS